MSNSSSGCAGLNSKVCDNRLDFKFLTAFVSIISVVNYLFNAKVSYEYTVLWCCNQGWKPGYLALGCQFQFRCVETQMSDFSFGLVSRLLKNRFQFRFQFCLRVASVSGFQFRFKFHPRKLFYCQYELFKSSTSWRFCFITMINSRSDGRVRKAITSEVVDLGMIPSPVKPKTQKLVFTASLFDAQRKRNCAGKNGDDNF